MFESSVMDQNSSHDRLVSACNQVIFHPIVCSTKSTRSAFVKMLAFFLIVMVAITNGVVQSLEPHSHNGATLSLADRVNLENGSLTAMLNDTTVLGCTLLDPLACARDVLTRPEPTGSTFGDPECNPCMYADQGFDRLKLATSLPTGPACRGPLADRIINDAIIAFCPTVEGNTRKTVRREMKNGVCLHYGHFNCRNIKRNCC